MNFEFRQSPARSLEIQFWFGITFWGYALSASSDKPSKDACILAKGTTPFKKLVLWLCGGECREDYLFFPCSDQARHYLFLVGDQNTPIDDIPF